MELPVKGNITSPEFSYRKLIFKTLTNLLVKIAVSPVTFMANSLGLSPDKLQSIPLDPCQWEFTSEQFSTLNDLAKIIQSKPRHDPRVGATDKPPASTGRAGIVQR